MSRKSYPTDVSDEEWGFVASYLTLMTEDAPQRDHPLREVFNGLRYVVRGGMWWRMVPNDLPPWYTIYQQTQRWLKPGVFEAWCRICVPCCAWRSDAPSNPPAPFSTVARCNPAWKVARGRATMARNGARAAKTHMAVDTLGLLLTLLVTPADQQDRAQVGQLAQQVQAVTGETVEATFVNQGYTGETTEQAAAEHGIRLEVVKLPDAKRGFVLLPRRWVVEFSFAWLAHFRRLARDYERVPDTLKGLHFLAFAMLMAHRFVQTIAYCL